MHIDEQAAAKLLAVSDNILIFCHRKPDGDTIGSAFALLRALELLGKTARIECADPLLTGCYAKIFGEYAPKPFDPAFIVAVYVADESLLGDVHKPYGGKINLCIDHHKSNRFYAAQTLLDADAAAAGEVVYHVVKALGVGCDAGISRDKSIADAVYTAISADTGCFRHANTTDRSLDIAAEMMRWGANSYRVNKLMFASKSHAQLAAEGFLLETLDYGLDGRYAQIYLPASIYRTYGVTKSDLDGVSAIPRTIEGVLAGVVIREKDDGTYRISMRTEDPIDASHICGEFGGGGHKNAAGCVMAGEPNAIKERLMEAVLWELNKI
jgi:phosphoesterase RecJ-like protein